MRYQRVAVFSLLLACSLAAAGKDKKKILLPDDVLEASTVLVVVDPDAGMAVDAPNVNRTAQEDVEKAVMDWGRFRLAMDASTADLVISIRRGNGKIAQSTVGGVPMNNGPLILGRTESGGQAGGRAGNPSQADGPTDSQAQDAHPQLEVGPADDMFAVYRGKRRDPLDSPAVWQYVARGALRSPGVPAVDAFRKLIAEAEKQKAARP